ncbi:hypothetical protein KTQ96_15440 [Prevotella copri]|uniref:hypothetical protein n=1 Tax=Segatella copri TaxID=165179 RepID=UPI001C2C44E1|nr:hypothetical protein [Segatella copri]MBU9909310.1 hypothetical protein [Segatella copri]MBV3374761.1 hypothetical protein [Segatella copri]
MKRTIITIDGNGILSIPSNLKELWMSEGELVNIFHATAPKLNSVIRAIYKEGILSMSEVQRKDETSVGVWQTLYSFPMIVVISFRLHSFGAAQLRDAIFNRLYEAKEKTTIVLQLYGGTNTFC